MGERCDILISFGSRLKKLRKNRRLSQEKLASHFGLAISTISMYERGEREPSFEILTAISDYFGVSVDYLLGKTDLPDTAQYPSPKTTENFTVYPVIGEVAAGYNHIAAEDWDGDTVEIPDSYLKGHRRDEFFVLSVRGNSMYPMYENGDKVLILRQSTLNRSGEIGVVLYDDECATLKKVEYKKGEDWLRLIPINPDFEAETISGERLEHCAVLGIPRLLIRDLD